MNEKNIGLEIGIFKIIWYSRKVTVLKWYNILSTGLMMVGTVMFVFFKEPKFSPNLSSFSTVAITGLSFTLALLIATTKNVFEEEDLKDLAKYDEKYNKFEFYKLIGPYIYTALLWLILGLMVVLKSTNIFSKILFLNSVLNFWILSIFAMGLCNLFDLIISNIQDLIKKIERGLDDEK